VLRGVVWRSVPLTPRVCITVQDGDRSRQWVWVPYTCYHHLYSRRTTYACAARKGVQWIHAMGDSQEREFVAHFKNMNGSRWVLCCAVLCCVVLCCAVLCCVV
jgi:hypothetical protein